MAVKVDINSSTGELTIMFPGRRWEFAHRAIESLKENPPRGYRMDQSWVRPRGKSGRRCNVRLTFDYIDSRVPPLAQSGAKAYFEPYALDAQGGDDGRER